MIITNPIIKALIKQRNEIWNSKTLSVADKADQTRLLVLDMFLAYNDELAKRNMPQLEWWG